MRTPMASSNGRRSSRPVVRSRFTASVSSVVSWRSSRFFAGTMMRTQGSFSNSPGVSTRSSCSCVPSPSSALTFSGWSLHFPCAAGDQRALERGVRAIVEQVHQRLPDHRARIGVAEQLQPGLVGVDHDAFLHLQDGVVGTLQHRLQLAAIVAGGLQRRVERALQTERAQLARHHRLHAFGRRQRDDVARAEAHARGDVGLGDLRPDQHHRHLRRELVAHRGRLPGIGFGHVGADQQLGVQLLERLAEVAHRRESRCSARVRPPCASDY